MAKAKLLKMKDAVEYDRKVKWLELRETAGVIPVTYHSERAPFLRFDCEDRVMMIEVRAGYYGKTWRCWDQDPAGAQTMKEWDDETEAARSRKQTGGKKTGAKKNED